MGFNIFAMPASSIALLFSVAFSVSNALPWAEPQKTYAYQADPWSPKPTGSPADPAELFKRTSVDVNVCGWIGGNSAQPAVCSSGSSCIHDTIHGYVGCCTTSGACTAGVYTSCVDSNSEGWSPNLGLADNGIYTCAGTSVCYRNTYPGGYYQYSCGASSQATSVATTYAGQPSDMYLQIVYTGVNFTPTSAPTTSTTSTSSSSTQTSSSSTSTSSSTSSSKSSSTTTSKTATVIGNASPSSTAQSAPPATSTTSPHSKPNVAAITGGTIGGLAGLAALIALALFLFRRHQKKNRYHAGPFITSHTSPNHPPSSGPFQRIAPFSPDDFVTPPHSRGFTTTEVTAGPITFPATYAYAGAANPHHPYSNAPTTPYFPPPARSSQDSQERDGTREEEPLVSEIDDFSRSFHNAMQQRSREEGRDTHIHSGVLPGGVGGTGIGMGIAAPLLGNHRTEDREARSEAFRSQLAERSAGWNSPLRSNPTYGNRSVGSDGGGDEEVQIPPKSPLRESMKVAGLGSAVGRSPDDDVRRYQLVDEVVGDDIPILHSPGQLRHSRQKSSG